ncbi:ribosomal protein S18-alanine N-acetyltransferase [Caldisalinibacter kiritimatiensis]|uniref:[Ribosomal protein bS18]-alanine N-acetyltransferase n=1 Tax=Caldisalinibacter kiritimatiensis TaxID=1304284 RepID=R1AUU4_9FIRM|nr:ribosomal protein S18-alanine N-acetyltransferase [Caldisalinibacter kiritimatiensis]EOD00407.1 Ribosomal-protein-S18p-alanine acetyltransferase [Caldisalinibacter kiritimatiensis]
MEKNNDDVIARKMTLDDLDEVMDIENKSFTTPWSRNAFITEVGKNTLAYYVVAVKDKKVVAYGGLWFVVDEGHITNIAVHPDYRGLGIGNVIVEELIRVCEERKLSRMTLEVRKSNNIAQSLYKKYGFESKGIRPGYYQDTKEDAIIMWKELR